MVHFIDRSEMGFVASKSVHGFYKCLIKKWESCSAQLIMKINMLINVKMLTILTFGPPTHWGAGEIDGLLVSPGKASKLLTDNLITDNGSSLSQPAQVKWFSQTIHTYKPYWLKWVVIFMKHILSVMTS